MTGTDELLDVPGVARLLSVGVTTIKHEIGRGRLGSVKVGRRRLIPRSAVVRYIELLQDEETERRAPTLEHYLAARLEHQRRRLAQLESDIQR